LPVAALGGPLGIARGEQNLEAGALLERGRGQLAPVHARHDEVGEDQVDRLAAREPGHGGGRIGNGVDAIAELGERLLRRPAHPGIVLDQQHALAAARQFRRRRFGTGVRLRRHVGARQVDLDARAVAELAVYLHVAVRLLDEAIDHGEAEAAALADRLGGEEGFEDVLDHVLRHA